MRRYAVAGIAAVVVVTVFFLFVLSPKLGDLSETRERIETARDEGQTLRNRLRQLQQAQRDQTQIEADLAAFDRLLPPVPELPDLIRQLQRAATASGIDLRSIAPGPPQALTGRTGVQSITTTVQVIGGFFRLQSFLTRLEGGTVDPTDLERVVEVTALSISPATDAVSGLTTLTTTITFRMYVVEPTASLGGAAPAPAPTPTAGG
jgi:Tfp pilus assembly protein PilO